MTINQDKFIFFESGTQLRNWLEKNHTTEDELFVGIYKKHTGKPSITWKDLVDELLCFGWIDGIAKTIDAERYCQRITPRRPKSKWSQINRDNVVRLIKENRMTPAGLKEVERAQADGRWAAAYRISKSQF